jgi:DNA invertase Pin-like site-specific DNA recombinase
MNNIAYSYIRCSSREQLKGDSIRRQLAEAERYASKHGLALSEQGYRDLGVSAYHEKNLKEGSEFMALIKAIEDRKIPKGSTLIIENLDRLSRGFITNSLPLFMRIINAGVRIATITDEKCYDLASVNRNPMDLMMAVMILSAANAESRKKNERITQAWQEAQKNADRVKIKTSFPSWLYLKGEEFSIRKKETELVKRIFKMFVDGQATTRIARTLNEEGVKTFTGKTWVATTIKFLLKNPAVIGEYHAGRRVAGKKVKTGQVVKGYYPVVISPSVFHRVQARFKLNPARIGRPQREDANLFAGIIKCPYCGSSMGINRASSSNSFICWRSVNGGCVRAAIPVPFVEKAVMTSTASIAKSMAVAEVDAAKIEALEGELAVIKKKVSNLVRLVADGGEIEEAKEKIGELKAEEREKQRELDQERAIDEYKEQETDRLFLKVISGVRGGPAEKKVRLSMIPHIRRYVAKVEPYFVGDKYVEYRRRVAELSPELKNGGAVFHRLRREFDLDLIQYVKVYFHRPISRGKKKDANVWTFRTTRVGASGLPF